MQRRSFLTLLGGAAAAWPLAAGAQQAMPVVGYVESTSAEASAHLTAAFRKGLSEIGFVEGRNVAIDYRWGQGQYDRLVPFVAELVRRPVTVIAAPYATNAAVAAKNLTTTIPVVFLVGGDPVELGLVASLNRPGGNATGFTSLSQELTSKRIGILRELVPRAARIAVLVNPSGPYARAATKEVQAIGSTIGWQIDTLEARTSGELDAVFGSLAQMRVEALFVNGDVFFTSRRVQFATLATHHRIPAIYATREFAEAGGLMSYGPSQTDLYRQVGLYTGRILKGEKPSDLPVMQPTKFEFVINLQTARTLGIDVPTTLLAIADEVIE
jgi:putative ABC transport system substrate-binding protein